LINQHDPNIFLNAMRKFNTIPIKLNKAIHNCLKILPATLLSFSFLLHGCKGTIPTVGESSFKIKKDILSQIGYSIQVGAFSIVENAVKLNKSLLEKGYDAYYFFDNTKLYKVRFGNYASLEIARNIAKELKSKGIITEYIIISPDDRLNHNITNTDGLRNELVLSAETFLGIPYYWGGISDKTGFDCSGLTMAVYKLNGLNLPRTTNEQWTAGAPVDMEHVADGDLVFFSVKKDDEISHVGIYIGDNNFIHAPGEGKIIQIDSLSAEYFQKHYLGARTYFR
jgi:cell wall-associated NlpC family hydrolase